MSALLGRLSHLAIGASALLRALRIFATKRPENSLCKSEQRGENLHIGSLLSSFGLSKETCSRRVNTWAAVA